MKRVNLNVFPKGGYKFFEKDGTLIAGTNWRAVINRVRAYRLRKGEDPGDVEQEVYDQVCNRNPGECVDLSDSKEKERQEHLHIATLKGRVLRWFAEIRRNLPGLVSEEDYRKRTDICANCPVKQPMPEGCSSCRAAVIELKRSIIGARPQDPRTEYCGCRVLGSDLTVQAWLDLQTQDKAELPDHCWMKRKNP